MVYCSTGEYPVVPPPLNQTVETTSKEIKVCVIKLILFEYPLQYIQLLTMRSPPRLCLWWDISENRRFLFFFFSCCNGCPTILGKYSILRPNKIASHSLRPIRVAINKRTGPASVTREFGYGVHGTSGTLAQNEV